MSAAMRLVGRGGPVMLLAVLIAACAGSGGAASGTPTATPGPQANMLQVTNKKTDPDGGVGSTATGTCPSGDPAINGNCGVTVSASCPSDEPMLSGGYALQADAGYIVSNYPVTASTWTVTAHNEGNGGAGGPVTLAVYADCLEANFPVTTHVVQAAPSVPADGNPHTVSASCPAGTTLTGGGFQGSNGNSSSQPSGATWSAQLSVQVGSTAAPKVFAICASGQLAAGATPSATAPVTSATPADVTTACPAGQLVVGGGYSEGDYLGGADTSAGTADFSQWHVQAAIEGTTGPGAAITETVYAVCATY
jgi:hypothetical protein